MLGKSTRSYRLADESALHAAKDIIADIPEPIADGVVLKVNVTGVTGSGTLDLYIQTTDDGGSSWKDMAHLTQLTATTANPLYVPIPVASGPVLCGQVGDKTAGAGTVTSLPMLSSTIRLRAVAPTASAYFKFTADILAQSLPFQS